MKHDEQVRTASHDPDFPDKFLQFMRTGWRDDALDVRPQPEAVNHARRRDRLSAAFPGETLVIPTGTSKVRANDTLHPFRPGSDFAYLTGDHDPDGVLVLLPGRDVHDAVLYTRHPASRESDGFFRDRDGELWAGRRRTLAEKATELGVQTAALADLDTALTGCTPGRTRVLRGLDRRVDAAVPPYDPVEEGARDRELAAVVSELKLVKDAWEIAQLRDAVEATVRGFEDVARVVPADRGVSERLIEGVFGLRARHDGNDVGYGSIVGAGAHATILCWKRNHGRTVPGELLLMDMGVENTHLYTADVTRTIPVSGTFSPLQREVYDIVYASQQAGIDLVGPGVKFADVHLACMRVLAEGLAELGVLPVGVDEAMDPGSMLYRRWTLHSFGHMLGIDVHDCAAARPERYREGVLGEGYVLTVEPGLYFQPEDDLVPAELRGVGIRLEDDILVTDAGAVNLSAGLPRRADEVESWLADQREAGPRLP
ncbi:aminopeptidase P family protein [Nonomuraea guangzhouensis]|uniref:Xaa-Pro aminopeptidase n=1 Tax=Nonomuraea guangzhouensis TaxID=1291555 RepID=A0ABW4G3Z2_9ACTN|nr:aminopeptidase P family protein [Nonomuraea guangzhouensis]